MTNEIKVGSRVRREDYGNGTVKDIDTFKSGEPAAAVKFDNGWYWTVSVDLLYLIPDTVTIEIPRELRDGVANRGFLEPGDALALIGLLRALKDAE